MSPSVEKLEPSEIKQTSAFLEEIYRPRSRLTILRERIFPPKERTPEYHFFYIDLGNKKPFDPHLFKELAKQTNYNKGLNSSFFKYIAWDNKMFIFSGHTHYGAYLAFVEAGVITSNDLQSAGFIDINYDKERWEIYGHSPSLEGQLSRNESEQYKFKVIKQKLGDFFKMSNRDGSSGVW